MSLTDLLLGRPLATREEGAERIGPAAGIPIFGLDALSSAAYGPEAACIYLVLSALHHLLALPIEEQGVCIVKAGEMCGGTCGFRGYLCVCNSQ